MKQNSILAVMLSTIILSVVLSQVIYADTIATDMNSKDGMIEYAPGPPICDILERLFAISSVGPSAKILYNGSVPDGRMRIHPLS